MDKYKELYNILFGVIVTALFSYTGIQLQKAANDIANLQNDLTIKYTEPFFSIKEYDNQYYIENQGGEIQYVIIKTIPIICITNYSQNTKDYYPLSNGFTETFFKENQNTFKLPTIVYFKDIDETKINTLIHTWDKVKITGLNYIILNYMDYNRQICEEHFILSEQNIVLIPISENYDVLIREHATTEFDITESLLDWEAHGIISNTTLGFSEDFTSYESQISEIILQYINTSKKD